jgi:hypothetical protein
LRGTALYTATFTPPTSPLTAITNTVFLSCQSNRFIDNSPNNLALTKVGDTSVQAYSPFGSISEATPLSYSNYFDGTGDYLTAAANAAFTYGTGNFTIEGWYYLTAESSVTKYLFDQRVSGQGLFPAIYVSSGSYIVYINSGVALTAGVVVSNAWVHWALVKNSSTTTLYINGTSVGSFADTNNYSTTAQFRIGSEFNSTGSFDWQGYISNLRVVKGTAVYTSAFTPSTTPLTAIENTSLLTCQSTRMIDNSTNAFAITAAGNTIPRIFNPFGYTAQSTTSYTPSLQGGSAYFDGSVDYLTTASSSQLSFGTGDFTIECWVYANG